HKSPSKRPAAMYAGFAILALLVLAGGALFLRNGVSSPSPTLTSEPTREFTPTVMASATAISITHTPEPEQSAVQEFNGDELASWTFFRKGGRANTELSYTPNDGKLGVMIDPNQDQPWAHLIQESSTYDDVLLEVVVTNNGFNNNGVSLICRHSEEGWIEFTVSNNQKYSILVYSSNGDTVQGGGAGSPEIPVGRVTNVYTATCEGNKFSLAVNGNHIHTIEANRDWPPGNIGIGFSAPADVVVDLEIESLKVSEP
ncbi:MAG TPA: family 16 glycoside hydrolase, partial [Anaerolineales bacterium]|nr:family 16 glycoside hydrolase [Anaerolineales bacterium]